MKTNQQQPRESGSTIVVATFTTLILGGFVALAVDYTGNIGRNAQRDRVFANAVEVGDGCLEVAFGAWRKLSATSENPPTSVVNAIPTPSPGNFPMVSNFTVSRDGNSAFTVSNFKIQAVDPMVTLASDNPPVSALPAASPPPKTTGPGTGTFSYFYLATADVTLPYMRGRLTAKVRRVFEKRYTSAWNWAMLYNDDLELHPDSPLTLTGWVHSNKNAYIGNGVASGNPTPPPTLTLKDRLTYGGNYVTGFAPHDLAHAGQTNVAAGVSPSDLPPGSEQTYAPFGWDPTKFSPGGNNQNDDSYREMIERKSVTGSNGDPFKEQRLWNQAKIAIEIDSASDGSDRVRVYVRDTADTDKDRLDQKILVTSTTGTGLGPTALQAAQASIIPGRSFTDNREAAVIKVVNFDVAEFIKKFPNSTSAAWNGIVHISDLRGSSTNKRAIRIVNGARVPNGGITVVSDNPVYVQGDFNTGRTKDSAGLVTAETPSNTGTFDDPDVTGYTRQPASIMADAISLLSNSWSDANSAAGVSVRAASNTTVNAALVAGNVLADSSAKSYSGGGENFVRLLEDWTGKSFTYHGSMVNLYQSQQGIGQWNRSLGGNVYLPGQQQWFFDKTLSVDAEGNPRKVPGYVSTVAYLQQQRWYLQY